jgi:AcrR family transcriptional regulator
MKETRDASRNCDPHMRVVRRDMGHTASRALCLESSAGELGAGEGDEFLVGVGVPGDAPAAVVGLGEDHPDSFGKAGAASGLGDDIGQSAYGGELFVTVERAGVGDYLDANPVVLAVDVRERGFMDEGRGVLSEQRDRRDAKGEARARMVEGTVRLLAENGPPGASFGDVLKSAGACRGSTYHHFPGGKRELYLAAVDRALGALESARGKPADVVVKQFFAMWRSLLTATELRAGCAVLAVAVGEEPETVQHAGEIFRIWRTGRLARTSPSLARRVRQPRHPRPR